VQMQQMQQRRASLVKADSAAAAAQGSAQRSHPTPNQSQAPTPESPETVGSSPASATNISAAIPPAGAAAGTSHSASSSPEIIFQGPRSNPPQLVIEAGGLLGIGTPPSSRLGSGVGASPTFPSFPGNAASNVSVGGSSLAPSTAAGAAAAAAAALAPAGASGPASQSTAGASGSASSSHPSGAAGSQSTLVAALPPPPTSGGAAQVVQTAGPNVRISRLILILDSSAGMKPCFPYAIHGVIQPILRFLSSSGTPASGGSVSYTDSLI
jgi:hypothetical protein